MDVPKQPSSLRIALLGVALPPCILFVSVMAHNGASDRLLKAKPSVQLHASKTIVTYPCPPGNYSGSRTCPTDADLQIALTALTTKGFNKQSVYVYTVTGGRILGEGSKVTWDLSETWPGIYSVTVEVQDNKKHRAVSSVNVTLRNCGDCVDEWPCPTIFVLCYDDVSAGTPITCKVVIGPSTRQGPLSFEWSTRDWNGEDLSGRISGQGKSISIRSDGLSGRNLNTAVKVKGLDPSCSVTASGSTKVKP